MSGLARPLSRIPLRARLVLLVAVGALPSLIGFLWYSQAARDDTQRVARDRAQLVADHMVDRLGGVLRAHERRMSEVVREPRIQELEREACVPLLRDFARQHDDYQAANLRALNGDLVCGLASDLMDGERLRRTPWYIQAVSSDSFLVSGPLFSSRSGRWVAPMMMPVRAAGGQRVGMLATSMDLLRLSDAVMADLSPEVAVVVSDAMGQVVLTSTGARAWVSLPAADAEVGVRESAMLARGPDGSPTERVTLHQPLGLHGWIIAVDVPQSQAYLAARRVFGYGVAASLLLLLGALALTWRMADGLLRPLARVRQALERVAAGDMSARVREDVGAPELRSVAAALNEALATRVAARAGREADYRLMSAVWDAARHACVAVDGHMRVTHINPAACAFTQWPADLAVGEQAARVCALTDPETRETVDLVASARRLAPDLGAWAMWQLRTRGGDTLNVLGRVVIWPALEGERDGLLVLFVDVSARSAAMRDLMDARGYTRQIIEGLPLGLAVRDRAGCYVEFNPVMERITGQSAQHLLGASTQEGRLTGAPVLRDSSIDTLERVLVGETLARPDAPSEANGLRMWYSAVHAPLRDSSGEITGVLSLLQDITARKEAEIALRDNEEGLTTMLRSIGDAVMATDVRGCVTRMNPTAERLTGWHLGEALGKPLLEVLRIVDAATRRPAQDPVQRVLLSGKVVGMAENTALLSRNGKEYLIADSAAPMRDGSGRIVGVVLVFSDVTEQHRLREVLRESEARFRAVVEGLPVGVMLYERRRIVYANPAAARIFGAAEPRELVGGAARAFLVPEQREEGAEWALRIARGEIGSEPREWKALRLDGRRIDVLLHMMRITTGGRPGMYVNFMDVTEARRNERALRESELRFRALASLAADWYWEQDEQFRFTRVEGRLHALSGRAEAEIIGRTRWELSGFELDPALAREHRALLEAHQEFRDLRTRGTSASGETFWSSVSGTPIFDAEGRFRGYRGIGRIVAAETQSETTPDTRVQLLHDAVTGLPSRRLFVERMHQAMASSRRHGMQAALLLVELGAAWQEACASAGGHGDAWPALLAQRLRACVREVDAVARLRVGQFVVLLDRLAEEPGEAIVQAQAVGRKILRAMDGPLRVADQSLHARACVGTVLLTRGDGAGEEPLRRADLAMRQWLEMQPHPQAVLDLDLEAVLARRGAIESGLRAALDGQHLQWVSEPCAAADGQVLGARISLRWVHPALGVLRQEDFLRVADAAHLLLPQGRWMLERACAGLADARSRTAPSPNPRLTLPVGACQLEDPGFAADVEGILRASAVAPGCLVLELEAPDLVRDAHTSAMNVARLRRQGVAISVLHRGPVHCPPTFLEHMQPSHFTIHRGLVHDILGDSHVQGAMDDITALAQRLGAVLMAEGVATTAQRDALLRWGCEVFLGSMFGEPAVESAANPVRLVAVDGPV